MRDASIHCEFDTLQNKVKIIIVDYNIYYKMKNMFITNFIDFTHVHVFSNWGKNMLIDFKFTHVHVFLNWGKNLLIDFKNMQM
jgi:hypothetical protein